MRHRGDVAGRRETETVIRDVEKDASAQHGKKCVMCAGGKHRGVSCGGGAQRVNVSEN